MDSSTPSSPSSQPHMTPTQSPTIPNPILTHLPTELLHQILQHLDLPDLLSTSRTSHTLRALTLDPLLHLHRLHSYRPYLLHYLPSRPTLADLKPPTSLIYLNRAHVVARSLSRQLIAIRLQRNLSRRPSASSLVQHNVLPEEVYAYEFEYAQRRGGTGKGKGIAPSLVSAKRSFERERVKDTLRGWLERRSEGGRRSSGAVKEERRTVRDLVWRFRAWAVDEDAISGGVGMGRGSDDLWGCSHARDGVQFKAKTPTRTKVMGLRRFWEGLASGTARLRET